MNEMRRPRSAIYINTEVKKNQVEKRKTGSMSGTSVQSIRKTQ